jgi:hypothetical protein
MKDRLPNSRFRIFLVVLAVCVATGLVFSHFEQEAAAGRSGATGTLEKLAADSGTATLNLDMPRLGSNSAEMTSLQFGLDKASLFTVLVFNGELRSALPGTFGLTLQSKAPAGIFRASQLVIESDPRGTREFTVRDSKSGFAFFQIEGPQISYDAADHSLTIDQGRLILSDEFAAALGRPADKGKVVGDVSIRAAMTPTEITRVVDGEVKSDTMPPVDIPNNGTNPGPDVVIGNLIDIQQFGTTANGQVGIAIGTEACNFGTVDVNWYALPDNDHPVIPQNLYRMSGGGANDQTFEQIGQSQMKHAFQALGGNICNLGCNGHGNTVLGSGCSDPYGAGYNAGPNLGSRAWVNPFTGLYVAGSTNVNNHSGHVHQGPSHRTLVNNVDLEPSLNQGATYIGESQYVTPHEYAWCTANLGQCIAGSGYNTFNNASWRRASVSGNDGTYNFTWSGNTVRGLAGIFAWTGATLVPFVPDPDNDGQGIVAYKVTNPSPGVYHYEYAIFNQNLDRAIQSFALPVGASVTKSNVGFHAPPQHPGWTFDGTANSQGYSSSPWGMTETQYATLWSSESFAQNPSANAVRWGTLYNIRFDSDREPSAMFATVSFFKTGNPVTVQVQGPSNPQAPWPCTSRRRNGVPLPNCG